jgi:hypothetical protein
VARYRAWAGPDVLVDRRFLAQCCFPDAMTARGRHLESMVHGRLPVSMLAKMRRKMARTVATPSLFGSGRAANGLRAHGPQWTATSKAAQISRMRTSPSRPIRSTRTATATLSTESRLTAERLGTGSSPGSSSTSLGNPRTVVVHGATSARLKRGMAASRERTTTGRRPMSANSHHHTSPRAGRLVTS